MDRKNGATYVEDPKRIFIWNKTQDRQMAIIHLSNPLSICTFDILQFEICIKFDKLDFFSQFELDFYSLRSS